jgi:hypothetical protein
MALAVLLIGSLVSGCAASAAGTLPDARRGSTTNRPLVDRCALVSTILTEPLDLSDGRARSFLDLAPAAGAMSEGGRLVVAVELSSGNAPAQAFFRAGEACGSRLALVSVGEVSLPSPATTTVHVRLRAESTAAFTFAGRFEHPSGQPIPDGAAPLRGQLDHSASGEWIFSSKSPRAPLMKRELDATPQTIVLHQPLPPGQVEAMFEVNTGGDIMGAPAREAGLVVVVRHDRIERRQTIASCAQVSRGSALGPVEDDVIDMAACGDLFRLVSTGGHVSAERLHADGSREVVSTIDLPDRHMRARRPRERN